MGSRSVLAVLSVSWLVAGPARAGEELLFRGARVFDGNAMVNEDVWVANGVIKSVGPKLRAPHATVVDGTGKTLLPGFIDAHSHAYEDKALKQALVFGVTTELEMFGDPQKNTALRKRERSGEATGQADLRSAGILATAPGGHGTEYGIPIPTLSRPDEAESFVRDRAGEGSDYLKIVVEPGFKQHPVPTLGIDITRALIEAAHRHRLLAVVHVSRQADARAVVEAGADGLAHIFVDEEPAADFAETVKAKHAFVIPTLAVECGFAGDRWAKALAEDPRVAPFLDEKDLSQLLHVRFPTTELSTSKTCDNAEHAVAQLYRAHVPLLAGTDALNPRVVHGASLHGELELLVEAGLSPKDALIAATATTAKQFHLDDRGRIAPGLRADLLLVEGDPTADIRQTRAIVGVWKRGVAVDRAAYRAGIDKQREEAVRLRAEAAPPGSESGTIATFESGKLDARFGAGWSTSTDALRGGSSVAKLDVVSGGAKSKYGLHVSGVIKEGFQFPWAGAMFSPGASPMSAANLSKKKALSFYAKGDGRTYRVMLFASQLGFTPAIRTFVAGPDWKKVSFSFADFGIDGRDVMGILWTGGPEAGAFSFLVDDLTLE
jgi:imidazolonepropionase-like amidohydrolase